MRSALPFLVTGSPFLDRNDATCRWTMGIFHQKVLVFVLKAMALAHEDAGIPEHAQPGPRFAPVFGMP